mmetsp:Transcript_93314/g.291934  ORF Transcript_93314/g.291934 Transcript_93314/m.291934 type:complete len:364 (+) Transcript_93314:1430-2521(+)
MAAFATVGLRLGRRPASLNGAPPLREAAAAATTPAGFLRAMKRLFRALALSGVGSESTTTTSSSSSRLSAAPFLRTSATVFLGPSIFAPRLSFFFSSSSTFLTLRPERDAFFFSSPFLRPRPKRAAFFSSSPFLSPRPKRAVFRFSSSPFLGTRPRFAAAAGFRRSSSVRWRFAGGTNSASSCFVTRGVPDGFFLKILCLPSASLWRVFWMLSSCLCVCTRLSAWTPTRSPDSSCTCHWVRPSSNSVRSPTAPLSSSLPPTPSSDTSCPVLKPSPCSKLFSCLVKKSTCLTVVAPASSPWMRSIALAGSSKRFVVTPLEGGLLLPLAMHLPLALALNLRASWVRTLKWEGFIRQKASSSSPSK